MVAEITPSGSGLDSSFGDSGLVCDQLDAYGSKGGTYVDGIVLNAHHGAIDLVGDGSMTFCCVGGFVAQLDQDTGALDKSFGNGGVASLAHPATVDADGQAIALQPNGDIVQSAASPSHLHSRIPLRARTPWPCVRTGRSSPRHR
jgi:hypothetical protein